MCAQIQEDALLARYHKLKDRRDVMIEQAHSNFQLHRELNTLNDRLDDLFADLKALHGSSP